MISSSSQIDSMKMSSKPSVKYKRRGAILTEQTGGGDLVVDPLATFFGRVGSIENADLVTAVLEPLQHVGDGGFCSSFPGTLAIFVGGIEEVGTWMRVVGTTVAAYVEDLCDDILPLEESDDLAGDQGLAASWQADHDQDDLALFLALERELASFKMSKSTRTNSSPGSNRSTAP